MDGKQKLIALAMFSTLVLAVTGLMFWFQLYAIESRLCALDIRQTRVQKHEPDSMREPVDVILELGTQFKIVTVYHDGHRITVNSKGCMLHHPQCDACLNFAKEQKTKDAREADGMRQLFKWDELREFKKLPEKPKARGDDGRLRERLEPASPIKPRQSLPKVLEKFDTPTADCSGN